MKRNINRLNSIRSLLQQAASISKANLNIFCKTGAGEYAEHDRFLGINVPTVRKLAKSFAELSLDELQTLIESPWNEERLLALFILINSYQQAEPKIKNELYQFYLRNLKQVNNWNLVDASAHLVIGAHLLKRAKGTLFRLAKSKNIWERRIAIVATWYFIRNQELKWTFKIAGTLLKDTHDLIHKATGWMLREASKKDQQQLIVFLDEHANNMPRTMLRYAIEKFPEPQRKAYLMRKKLKAINF